MRDFYEVLGVARNASIDEIRSAYKRLAKQYHPDANRDNPQAEEIFKIVNEAYHTLADPVKKSRYDLILNGFSREVEDAYWKEVKKRRYYEWRKSQEKRYRFDKDYFKIQGLAFLVFFVLAGFCFAIINTGHYYVRQQELQKKEAESKLLNEVNGLFLSGKFNDAFSMINVLEKREPFAFRFIYARDSLVEVLRSRADKDFDSKNFQSAAKYYEILSQYETPKRIKTLERISLCQYYMGDYLQSLQSLKQLHNQEPGNMALIYQIGQINLEKLNNAEEALYYFSLGKKLMKENLSEIYGKAFTVVMDPKDAPDIYYYIFMGRGQANIRLRKYDDAITDFNWAIFLREQMADPYYLRAVSSLRAGTMNNVCTDLRIAKRKGIAEAVPLQKKYCQ